MVRSIVAFFLVLASVAQAQVAGEVEYDTVDNRFEFYNGSTWISMDLADTTVSCAGFSAGTMRYDSTNNQYEFCDGSTWRSMSGSDTSAACSIVGALQYNTTTNKYEFCQGSTGTWWTAAPASSDPCSGKVAGEACAGTTALYLGEFDGYQYMVTPGGCDGTTSNPTCGGSDGAAVNRAWASNGSSDIAGISNISNVVTTSSPSETGDVNTPLIVADATTLTGDAAVYCSDMDFGGYNDWYLASKSEMAFAYCQFIGTNHITSQPDEDPDCATYGKNPTPGLGFANNFYWTSTEASSTVACTQSFDAGGQLCSLLNKNNTGVSVRCLRRYPSTPDYTPDALDWVNFSGTSTDEAITGINQTITLQISATNGTGTPVYEYRVNSGSWTAFTTGSPANVNISKNDTLGFRVTGTGGHNGTITIINTSDGNLQLDTVVGTALAPDVTPDAVNWADFSGVSTDEAITGINQTITLEFSAVNGTGTPTYEYRKNSGAWTAFTTGTPGSVTVDAGDTIGFQVSGTGGHSGTITVTNITDSSTILDTAVGTVFSCGGYIYGGYCWYAGAESDSCTTTCSTHGGAVLAGQLWSGSGAPDGSRCEVILNALLDPDTTITVPGCSLGWGCAKYGKNSEHQWCGATATTNGQVSTGHTRACACAN